MNRLSRAERAEIVRLLVEGNSIRGIRRITGRSNNTIQKLLLELGAVCKLYQNVHLRDLTSTRIECDEIRTFVRARTPNLPPRDRGRSDLGETWIWVALDPDSKLVCSWLIGKRDTDHARRLITDLGSRLSNQVQLTTDGHVPYIEAVEDVFGMDVDYGITIKEYGWALLGGRPARILSERKIVAQGRPSIARISTSGVERQNLTMRTGMRRLMRLTNGFSKSATHLRAAVDLHYMYYNFARPHKSLANPYPRTPAMAAGIDGHIWAIEEIVDLLDEYGVLVSNDPSMAVPA